MRVSYIKTVDIQYTVSTIVAVVVVVVVHCLPNIKFRLFFIKTNMERQIQ